MIARDIGHFWSSEEKKPVDFLMVEKIIRTQWVV